MTQSNDPVPVSPPGAVAGGTGWYRTEDLARWLKVDPSTVRRWRTASPPQGPPFVRLSERLVLYGAADVRQWLADRRVDPKRAG